MARMMMRRLALACVFVGLSSIVSWAQSSPRVIVGGAVGLGNSTPALCAGCRTGLDVSVQGGVMLARRVAIQGEGLFLSVAPTVLSQTGAKHDALVGTIQYWPVERLWLSGGGGMGSVERHTAAASARSSHPAGVVGAGWAFNPRSLIVMAVSFVTLVSGDDEAQFADEPVHKAVVATPVIRFGVTWRQR